MNKSTIIISVCILIVIIILAIVVVPSEKSANWKHFEYWKSMYMEQPDNLIKRSNGTFDSIARLTFDRVDLSSRQTVDTYLLCSKILINHAVLNDDYKKIANLYFDNNMGCNLFDYIYKNCISAILATSNKLKDIRKIVNQFINIYAYMPIIKFNDVDNVKYSDNRISTEIAPKTDERLREITEMRRQMDSVDDDDKIKISDQSSDINLDIQDFDMNEFPVLLDDVEILS